MKTHRVILSGWHCVVIQLVINKRRNEQTCLTGEIIKDALSFNPFTPPTCYIPGHIKTAPSNSVFDGAITNLISILCILIKILSRADGDGPQNLNDFKFGTFIAHFTSDDAASLAVKGLIDAACITHIVYRL